MKGEVPAEGDTEAIRHKYRLIANHWLVVRMRHPSHRAFHDLHEHGQSTWNFSSGRRFCA